MKAFVLSKDGALPTVVDTTSPLPKHGEAKVRLHAAAWNRRDHWIIKGQYPNVTLPVTLGSDGCGFVEECDSTPELIGQEVIICPSLNWGENPTVQSKQFEILGMPTNGTFAQEIAISIENLFAKPPHLSAEEAAAIPLAGLTAWRAISTRARVQRDDRVLITGIGGGTAVFALQFAKLMGAKIHVTSSSERKIEQAMALGADGGTLYTQADWSKQLKRTHPQGFDVIIDSAGGDGFGDLVKLLGMGGRLVFFGGTRGKWPSIRPQYLFFKQVSLLASTMGSPTEFQDMCSFITEHKLKPVVDSTFPLQEAQRAITRLLHPERFGKVVLQTD